MKSPFPGMDPYLEQHWGDVHSRLCTYACDQIQEQLTDDLTARLGERLVVESPFDAPRCLYPDVRVVDHGFLSDAGPVAVLDETIAEPIVIRFGEAEVQPFIEIIESDSASLITVIEILNPTNMWSGNGREQYQRKQRELYNADVNLVEIDLIRAGPRVFMLPSAQIPHGANTAYAACVFRATKKLQYELYPMPLRERLRPIRVPLRKDDTDVVLRLQPLIEMAYHNGRYNRTDYQKPCIPPLEGEDAEWAKQLASAK